MPIFKRGSMPRAYYGPSWFGLAFKKLDNTPGHELTRNADQCRPARPGSEARSHAWSWSRTPGLFPARRGPHTVRRAEGVFDSTTAGVLIPRWPQVSSTLGNTMAVTVR